MLSLKNEEIRGNMAAHRNRVHVHSFVDGRYLRSVPIREAREMLDSGDAESMARHRDRITAIRLRSRQRTDHKMRSGAITSAEAENNALAHNGAQLAPDERIGTYQRSIDKISAWPEIHDDRATVVCAGRVYGQG